MYFCCHKMTASIHNTKQMSEIKSKDEIRMSDDDLTVQRNHKQKKTWTKN